MTLSTELINAILFFILITLLSSCRTAGLYTSNPKSRAAFAGTEFRLTKTDSFFIRSWTDTYTTYVDGEGNRIFKEDIKYRGFGTYLCLDDSLALTFSNEDSISIVLDLESRDTSVKLTFQVFDELGNIMRPNADILDQSGSKIEGTIVQFRDTFDFEILKIEKPSQIQFSGFGMNFKNPIIEITDLESGQYVFKRKSYNGYFGKGEVKKIWFKKVFTGIRYELNNRKRYLPKKFGWSWINKFYRDY